MKSRFLLIVLALSVLGLAGCTTESEDNGVKVERRYFGG